MSPARQHRERHAASAASPSPTLTTASGGEGGHSPFSSVPLTPAREHRVVRAAANATATGVDPIAAQIRLRLAHDLRRLKQMQSIERKVDAKREMLPAYIGWCDGLLSAAQDTGKATADDVLATVLVWSIDAQDWPRAIELAAHVLRHDLAMPARYQRTAAALIAEEVATNAIKAQAAGEPFPIDVLEEIDVLTADADMHDEIRAKLMKAIGFELARAAEAAEGADAVITAAERALVPLRRAQQLHDRVGAKDKIKRMEKAAAAARAATESAGTPPA